MKILNTLAIVTISSIMATTAVSADNNMSKEAPSGKCYKDGKYNKGGKHHRGGKHQKIKAALKAANITDEQKASIKEVRKSMRESMKAQREAMKASHAKGQFISVNGVDREAMITKSVERATFKANMKADMIEKVLAILTAEQRTQFVQALQETK